MTEHWHDFRVAPVHCDLCWEDQQKELLLVEQRRANDLLQRKIELMERKEWNVPEVQTYRPIYRPQTPQQPKSKGGIPL